MADTGASATAGIPNPIKTSASDSVKIATPDLLIFGEEVVAIEVMTDLIFEDIGGFELATISRHDLVNGQEVVYAPIKNLTDLYLQYNPNNILRIQSSESYFKSLPLSIFDHIPVCGTGYDISPPESNPNEQDKTKWVKTPNCKSVYIDPITGDLIINLINVKENEQVEVQILSDGEIFNDTIYNGSN